MQQLLQTLAHGLTLVRAIDHTKDIEHNIADFHNEVWKYYWLNGDLPEDKTKFSKEIIVILGAEDIQNVALELGGYRMRGDREPIDGVLSYKFAGLTFHFVFQIDLNKEAVIILLPK